MDRGIRGTSGRDDSHRETAEGRCTTGERIGRRCGMESLSTEIAPEEFYTLVVVFCRCRGGWGVCGRGGFAITGYKSIKEYKARLILDDGRAVNITDTTSQIIAVSEGASVTTSGSGLKYEMKKDSLASPARVKYNTLIVPRGGEYELLLSDGTRVWMNSESKLVYPVHFSGDFREVQMEGEVCFKVAKNERQPFIVKTQGISVEVLGTFFNVEAYPTDEVITTTLVEGRVNVSNGKQECVMSPNQQVIADGGQLVVREVDAAEVVRWIEGVCYFSETSLEDIMDKLARWYDVEIFFANASAKEAHFSLEIERYDNIAAVLSKIEKTGRVKFKINGRTVIVEE